MEDATEDQPERPTTAAGTAAPLEVRVTVIDRRSGIPRTRLAIATDLEALGPGSELTR